MPDQPIPAGPRAARAQLGRTIRRMRQCRELSQEEFGSRAGLHRNYVGAIERGEINPTFKTLLLLADGLNMTLLELVAAYQEQHDQYDHALTALVD